MPNSTDQTERLACELARLRQAEEDALEHLHRLRMKQDGVAFVLSLLPQRCFVLIAELLQSCELDAFDTGRVAVVEIDPSDSVTTFFETETIQIEDYGLAIRMRDGANRVLTKSGPCRFMVVTEEGIRPGDRLMLVFQVMTAHERPDPNVWISTMNPWNLPTL